LKKFITKSSSFIVILALVFLLIPQAHAAKPNGNITFNDQMFNPHPLGSSDAITYVTRNFILALPITSTNGISKVTVKIETFKADMAFSRDASCKYCIGYIADIQLGSKIQNGIKKIVVTATDMNKYSASHTYYVTLVDQIVY
jgi:hypothetical protein